MNNNAKRKYTFHGERQKHGMAGTRVHQAWMDMIKRCTRPDHVSYRGYGGRGIKVYDRWMTFTNFYEDMGEPEDDSLTLDRINGNGDYEPGNYRWASWEEQALNRSGTNIIDFNGKVRSLTGHCRELGMSTQQVSERLKRGYSPEEALLIQANYRMPLPVIDESITDEIMAAKAVVKYLGLSERTLQYWRITKKQWNRIGSKYSKVGTRNIRYKRSDLDNWAKKLLSKVN